MADLAGLPAHHVAVLPDLFVDAFVPLPPWAEASQRMSAIAQRGGGNLPVGPIELRLGGNAANLGKALAALGAHVDLLAETDAIGQALAAQASRDTGLGVVRVRTGAPSVTVALECEGSNLMLSHAGPVAAFGPDALQEADRAVLGDADAVAVVNWGQNPHGTALLRAVRGAAPDAFLYLDTGDPSHRAQDIPALLQAVEDVGVDAWAMNENEAGQFGGHGDPLDAARSVAARCGVHVDLHTRHLAVSIGDDEVRVDADETPARRLTGAGDHWNAGNLAGYLLGLPPADRLALAHRVATCYVTSPSGASPGPAQV